MQSNPSRFEFGSLFLLLIINKKKLYTVKRNFTVLGWVGLVRKSILRVKALFGFVGNIWFLPLQELLYWADDGALESVR